MKIHQLVKRCKITQGIEENCTRFIIVARVTDCTVRKLQLTFRPTGQWW